VSYQLTFKQQPGYLHAIVSGENTRETALRYLEELLAECAARGADRILLEERLEGPRLPLNDVLEVLGIVLGRAARPLPTIAYVDVNASGIAVKVAETVAVSRGVNVWVFPTVAQAQRWLEIYIEAPAGPDFND
jgi:hypothetical protein